MAPDRGNPLSYQPGDIVNGHVLGTDNQWHPLPADATQAMAPGQPTQTMPGASINGCQVLSNRPRSGAPPSPRLTWRSVKPLTAGYGSLPAALLPL